MTQQTQKIQPSDLNSGMDPVSGAKSSPTQQIEPMQQMEQTEEIDLNGDGDNSEILHFTQ